MFANKKMDIYNHILQSKKESHKLFALLFDPDKQSKKTLINILTEPQNALIKQYVKLFEMDDVQLTFDKEVLEFIVDKAITLKLGARGLRSICEAILTDAMFDAPSAEEKELVIDLAYAQKQFLQSKISKLKVA